MNKKVYTKTKNPATLGEKLGFNKSNIINDISLTAQRQRLLAELREDSITTIEARDNLNILAPAARVFELRHDFGYNIVTTWTVDIDSSGRKHRIARYTLLNGKWNGRNSKEVKYAIA